MQQQPDLTQSQKAQPEEPFYLQIERAQQHLSQASEAEAEALQDEVRISEGKQWSLLKFVFNHPEYIDYISNPQWFDDKQRSIYFKLQGYVQFLKKNSQPLNNASLLGCFDNVDRFFLESDFAEAKEPEGPFNAQRLCDELNKVYERRQRFLLIRDLILAKDKETLSLHARQLTNIYEAAPVHAKIFGTDTDIPKTNFTLKKDGVPILEDQNFYVVMGKEKSGKSHMLAVFLAAYLFGSLKEFGLESMIEPNSKILYIDTEQSGSDAHNICQTANLLAGRRYNAPNKNLIIASCDEVPASQMITEIRSLIDRYKPKVVFLDGYAGLLEDVYKNAGVDPIMKEVRTIARQNDLIIIGVFHTKTDTSNPLSNKEDSVTAFGAFGKLFQKYGGGTFLVENAEGLISVTHHQARKSKCPTFYCKLDGRIYIDIPGRVEPDIYKVSEGNADEVLRPMHKTINDKDVHSFAVPLCLSEGEYNEVADIKVINKEKEREERAAQLERTRQEQDINKYRENLAIVFKTDDELLTQKEMFERWYIHAAIKERTDKLDSKEKARWKKRLQRIIQASFDLEILYDTPSGKIGLKNIPSQV